MPEDMLSAKEAAKQWECMWDHFVAEHNHCSLRKARALRKVGARQRLDRITKDAREAEKQFESAMRNIRRHFKSASDQEKPNIIYHLSHSVIYP